MRISRKQTIANIPIIKIRDYFDYIMRYNHKAFDKKSIQEYLGLTEFEVEELLKDLCHQGFIVINGENYVITIKGSALRIARCVPPINKTKADAILKDFMQRVNEINDDEYYLYKVTKVLLFGSYIRDDAADYGDIDIAFELRKKNDNQEEFFMLNKKLVDEAKNKGRNFGSFIEELNFSRRLVLLKLKNRNRYISLHEMSDDILEVTKVRQIFP